VPFGLARPVRDHRRDGHDPDDGAVGGRLGSRPASPVSCERRALVSMARVRSSPRRASGLGDLASAVLAVAFAWAAVSKPRWRRWHGRSRYRLPHGLEDVDGRPAGVGRPGACVRRGPQRRGHVGARALVGPSAEIVRVRVVRSGVPVDASRAERSRQAVLTATRFRRRRGRRCRQPRARWGVARRLGRGILRRCSHRSERSAVRAWQGWSWLGRRRGWVVASHSRGRRCGAAPSVAGLGSR
jgi:hypothetical protein